MARPASFDREQVLERATATFWEHGYCATSVSQLVQATHLQPGSLYAAFESKEGLFLAALDHYARHSVERLRDLLEDAPDPVQGIETFFEVLVSGGTGDGQRRGCLLVNTVLEIGRHNPGIQARVKSHLDEIEGLFVAALEQAQALGLLGADRSPGSLAKFLMTTLWGLRVLGGTGADAADQRLVVRQALSVLRT
ncbi:MAG: TetR/AcrR family transcriptional regulator [Chromatiaceae bacterium]|jgi:TetR/AcrR family transcriptional repressor of nem operon|nr:TetR/AcrR family transcriptional regulator [Chromatiaceae bacterium]